MIKYNVRARALVDVMGEIKSQKLILDPYFQRKLVWREGHKVDFIETILARYPFPEIFVARGELDVDEMTSTSCIVDGQQRLNSIREFIADKFPVHGKLYSQLSPSEKGTFLKYEIAIIELDLAHNDPQIIEIFKRLNRTFYALSTIEKQATEYASSEFMLLAKLLSGELRLEPEEVASEETATPEDPNISLEFSDWAKLQKVKVFQNLVLESDIFTKYEISRMVHLAFTLNLMATFLGGYYNRNEKAAEYLELYKDGFKDRDTLVLAFNHTAKFIEKMGIFSNDFWLGKSNIFSLFLALAAHSDHFNRLDQKSLSKKLAAFAKKPPTDYALAAREGVNNKQERLLRYEHIERMIESAI